jgi:tetratricopeptide (TPR) repeat protein
MSYLKYYFAVSRDTKDLLKSLEAYNTPKNSINPDLYLNRATIHQYLENYELAISDYKRASELDTDLLSSCEERLKHIHAFINNFSSVIQKQVFLNLNLRLKTRIMNHCLLIHHSLIPLRLLNKSNSKH